MSNVVQVNIWWNILELTEKHQYPLWIKKKAGIVSVKAGGAVRI